MLARLTTDLDLRFVEDHGVKSKYVGEDDILNQYVVTSLSIRDDENNPELKLTSIEDKTIHI